MKKKRTLYDIPKYRLPKFSQGKMLFHMLPFSTFSTVIGSICLIWASISSIILLVMMQLNSDYLTSKVLIITIIPFLIATASLINHAYRSKLAYTVKLLQIFKRILSINKSELQIDSVKLSSFGKLTFTQNRETYTIETINSTTPRAPYPYPVLPTSDQYNSLTGIPYGIEIKINFQQTKTYPNSGKEIIFNLSDSKFAIRSFSGNKTEVSLPNGKKETYLLIPGTEGKKVEFYPFTNMLYSYIIDILKSWSPHDSLIWPLFSQSNRLSMAIIKEHADTFTCTNKELKISYKYTSNKLIDEFPYIMEHICSLASSLNQEITVPERCLVAIKEESNINMLTLLLRSLEELPEIDNTYNTISPLLIHKEQSIKLLAACIDTKTGTKHLLKLANNKLEPWEMALVLKHLHNRGEYPGDKLVKDVYSRYSIHQKITKQLFSLAYTHGSKRMATFYIDALAQNPLRDILYIIKDCLVKIANKKHIIKLTALLKKLPPNSDNYKVITETIYSILEKHGESHQGRISFSDIIDHEGNVSLPKDKSGELSLKTE